MKLRALTLGLQGKPTPRALLWADEVLRSLAERLTGEGYGVQSRRLALEHWDQGLGALAASERHDVLLAVDAAIAGSAIDVCSIGAVRKPADIRSLAELLLAGPRLSASADVASTVRGIDAPALRAAGEVIGRLAAGTDGGLGNFRFCAGFCLTPGIPFFPSSYHDGGRPAFAIGLQNADLLVGACRAAGHLAALREQLAGILHREYTALEAAALRASRALDLAFSGIDPSINPSLEPDESVVDAFAACGVPFAAPGTLAACGLITDVVRAVPVQQVGYRGILLPVLEDPGLAEAMSAGRLGIRDLLTWSSVCGIGVDMVPLPGAVSRERLEALMLDVGTMAVRLQKPLSLRVLPVPGKGAGDWTAFDSPYLCNSRIVDL